MFQSGMAVAISESRKKSLSQEEVKRDALDDFCNSAGVVAGRPGIELHDGWLHPLVVSARARGAGD